MTIDRGTVQHIARLAELAVSDEEAHALAGQLERIVTFVEQLGELDIADGTAGAVVVGPERTPLREDIVAPIPMAHAPEAMAPAMQDGLFLVPRLGGMAAE
jgi:aspartyl-tRNA(Asn)/glutamyl-tRNA(Gln) amidotransferase subunit C